MKSKLLTDKYQSIAIQELLYEVSDTINKILRENIYETNLNRQDFMRLENQKKMLRAALKVCATGDHVAKDFVKELIKEIIVEKYRISSENIDDIIHFGEPNRLSSQDKFQIILLIYYKQYKYEALKYLITDNELDLSQNYNGVHRYIITNQNVDELYKLYAVPLSYMDKLNIVTQRVYSLYRGLGIADDIRDMDIDGVSGGVSGTIADGKTLWIFFQGKSINLQFLKFESECELERICNNIYRNNQPGHLSRSRGYIVNDMKDHSRVVVARPPFCESWVFFVRKFNKEDNQKLNHLYMQKNSRKLNQLMVFLVKGCRNCAITGTQGSGKTTLLMALIHYINPNYNLRIQEQAFELHLRDIYPDRNIVTFRETDYITGQAGLDLQKKTDGTVNILGEVASAPVAGWMIQMGLTASLFTMFTHHAKTTESLISAMCNALLSENIYQNEEAARKQVTEVIRFDIHVGMDKSGERFVEKITEIVCCEDHTYYLNELVKYVDGCYQFENPVSENSMREMCMHLCEEEKEVFLNEFCV